MSEHVKDWDDLLEAMEEVRPRADELVKEDMDERLGRLPEFLVSALTEMRMLMLFAARLEQDDDSRVLFDIGSRSFEALHEFVAEGMGGVAETMSIISAWEKFKLEFSGK